MEDFYGDYENQNSIISQEIQENSQKIEQKQDQFDFMFIFVGVFIAIIFVVVIAMFISPKLRGKMMSRQVKAMKHMADYSKDDLESISSTLGGVAARSKKRILAENEDVLRDASERDAELKSIYVKKMAGAVKEGLSGDTSYCKYCGAMIESDSVFCKKCGKKQ